MKKKLLFFAVAALTSLGLRAGTLYWQLNNNPNNDQYAAVAVLSRARQIPLPAVRFCSSYFPPLPVCMFFFVIV